MLLGDESIAACAHNNNKDDNKKMKTTNDDSSHIKSVETKLIYNGVKANWFGLICCIQYYYYYELLRSSPLRGEELYILFRYFD